MAERNKELVTKVSILSVAFLLYTTSILQSTLGAIAKAFPGTDPETVKLLQSITPLMMLIFSTLCGQLERFISKRKILFAAMCLMVIGGVTPAFFGNSFEFLIVMKGVFGAGYGLAFPLSASLIADFFDGRERSKMMGFKGAVGAASGVVMSMLGGVLANIHWRYAYLGYLLIIPVALFIMFTLPEPDKSVKKEKPAKGEGASWGRLTPLTFIISLLNIGFNIMMYTFFTSVAIVIVLTNVGNSAQAGMVNSMYTACAFVAGLLFVFVKQIFKRYTIVLAVALVGASFLTMLNANSFPLFILGGVLFGLGFGTYNPEMNLLVIGSAKEKSAATLAMSVYVAGQAIGQFISPIILKYATGMLGLAGPKAGWMIAAPALLVASVVLILFIALVKPKNNNTPINQ
ncbi:MFS transporter [Desulfitobacterium chlororespirans]|uniref:Predicted arabinose efflux permease, MFS family n=1 Tax=Desulfitobacterium chlororespirans DSM 11544 TaxID=1121395 RepID=A0A1M7SG95_9FIRM|nr:MFS transporter [Desulfitobacterium chlororespirans]SHN57487.1 Predicted arabinose efflux permease, MFS family [Desulfitobacterium chlororespirans DSM 11544]